LAACFIHYHDVFRRLAASFVIDHDLFWRLAARFVLNLDLVRRVAICFVHNLDGLFHCSGRFRVAARLVNRHHPRGRRIGGMEFWFVLDNVLVGRSHCSRRFRVATRLLIRRHPRGRRTSVPDCVATGFTLIHPCWFAMGSSFVFYAWCHAHQQRIDFCVTRCKDLEPADG